MLPQSASIRLDVYQLLSAVMTLKNPSNNPAAFVLQLINILIEILILATIILLNLRDDLRVFLANRLAITSPQEHCCISTMGQPDLILPRVEAGCTLTNKIFHRLTYLLAILILQNQVWVREPQTKR